MSPELSTVAPPAPPTRWVRPPDVPPLRFSTGKSEAPATRTCASATRDCSSAEPKLVHQVGETPAPFAGTASFHVPATGTSGFSSGLTIAQPESEHTSARAIDRRISVFMASLRCKGHDGVEPRGLASWEVPEDQTGQERAGEGERD